jgi:phospholipase/carboxylesterase
MYLGRAFRAGFDDIGHVAADPDFDSVRAGLHFVATVESAAAAAARRQTTAGIRVDVVTPTMLPCYVRLPDGWSPDSSYPLVVGLHGYGSNPEQFNSLYERAGRPRVIFASLRAPYPLNIGGEPGYSWSTWTDTDTAVGPASSQMSAEAVSRLVMELKMRYRAGDVYVLGFSQGAGLAYRVGLRFGFAVRGIICFGGSLDTTRLPMSDFMVAARDTLRVFIGHGREDRVIEVSAGRASRDFLKRFGVDVTYLEFAGGHAVPEDPLRKAFGWMLKPPRTRRH